MEGKIKEGDSVLLLGKKTFLINSINPVNFHTEFGVIELKKLIGKKYGLKIKSKLGHEFAAIKPTLNDFLEKRIRRLPQIISLKDCSIMVGYTGLSNGWRVVDGGTGSGFLSLFLANAVKPDGKVFTYEKRKDFYKVAKTNIKNSGLEKYVQIKNKDMTKGIKEKNIDLITLDMAGAEKVIPLSKKALKPGGWLVIYSPYIEQVKRVHSYLKDFKQIKTLEVLVREYKITPKFSRPKTKMIGHTGYITLARWLGRKFG